MSHPSQHQEELGNRPDPARLLNELDSLAQGQPQWNHLRDLFLEESDLDEYINWLDTDEDIDLTRKQISRLKAAFAGYREYLKEYLDQTGARIGRFEAKLKQSVDDLANPDLTPEEVVKIAHTRKRVAQAMQIARAPRGPKRTSLRKAVGKTADTQKTEKLEDKTEVDYAEFIEHMNLSAEQKEKLRAVIEGYEEAVATAKELDSNVQVPSKEQVIAHVLALGAEKLEKIATIMGKPGLTIEPDKSFMEMKNAMNARRHYDNQSEAYFDNDYEWSGRPGKVSVSILDMIQNTSVVPGQRPGEQRNDEQLRTCEKYFRDNGMRLASDRQNAAGMQKSLRAYEQAKRKGEANPEKHILDFYGQPQETVTMFNQEHNTTISKIVYGSFNPGYRKVYFFWRDPAFQSNYLRGRGAMQVM